MEEIAIDVKNISKRFKVPKKGWLGNFGSEKRTFLALDNISFQLPRGKMFSIMGLNGSGKTTLLRVLAGIYKPDSGIVTMNGRLSQILHVGTGFNEEFPARDNIIASGILLGMEKSEIEQKIDKIIQFAELEKFADQKLKHYSTGMRGRLACSTALEVNPDILLMDEILSTGDIRFREKSYKAFLSFKEKGKTVLFTTHSIPMTLELAEKVILLDKGRVVTIGKPPEVISKYKEIAGSNKIKTDF